MRILHVHERAGFYGGIEQILYDTARGLGDLGWPQGLLHKDTAPQPDFLKSFSQASRQESMLEKFAPDVLFLHKAEQPDEVRRLVARVPSVRMVHDHDLVCLRRHKYFPISTRVCDRPAGIDCYLHLCFVGRAGPGNGLPIHLASVAARKRAIRAHDGVHRFLVGSEWMRRELTVNGIAADKIRIVPPIPAALRDIEPAPAPAPAPASPEILFVGQVIRGKGVDLLLRALSQVSPPWHATVVGTGNHMETCIELAQDLGIAQDVHFAGWVPHSDLTPLYTKAAFTVVPSRWPEPFGMVGIEAMARGRPVVGFAAGGIPDWLEDGVTGLLAPEADTDALAVAIDQLLRDVPFRTKLGEAAAHRVREHYQPQHYLKQLMSILEAVA